MGAGRFLGAIPSARTHGRWPWLSAIAAPPATGLAIAKRGRLRENAAWAEWLPLVALLCHQTEEWVWPGGFLPWFNRTVLDSGEDEFPIDRRLGLLINVGMGWAVGAAAAGTRSPAVSAFQLALIGGNAGLHVSQAIASRSRNPGLVTSVTMFVPLTATGFPALWRRSRDRRSVASGAAVGAAASLALMVSVRVRLLRRRSQRSPALPVAEV